MQQVQVKVKSTHTNLVKEQACRYTQMELKEIGRHSVQWIPLTHDKVDMVISPQILHMQGIHSEMRTHNF
jgi:hypothetical protein